MKMILQNLMVIILASFAVLSAQASDHPPVAQPPAVQPLILGQWGSEQPISHNGFAIYTEFKFTAQHMKMKATCVFRYNNAHLTVAVRSEAAYGENQIFVLESNKASVNDGYHYCNAGLEQATWSFYFNSADLNRAVLIAPIPYNNRFQVRRLQ